MTNSIRTVHFNSIMWAQTYYYHQRTKTGGGSCSFLVIDQQLSVKLQLLSEISPSEMKQLDLRNWGMHYISVSENAVLLAQKYSFNRYLKFTTHIREIKLKSRQQTLKA